jgi:hypothetical protein
MGKERRRAKRVESNLFALVRNLGEEDASGRAVVVNASTRGFGIETELDLETEKEYEFDIEVPLTFRAKVVRSLTPGQMKRYGVQVTGLGFFGRLLLNRLLKGNLKTVKF